jgi:flagellar biosynthesis/type III secretory pathway M-ring protein FliF/YscJ
MDIVAIILIWLIIFIAVFIIIKNCIVEARNKREEIEEIEREIEREDREEREKLEKLTKLNQQKILMKKVQALKVIFYYQEPPCFSLYYFCFLWVN